MTRTLSGIQPSGTPHLGNYFGAIRTHVETSRSLKDGDSAFFFIADYHALTTVHDRETLASSVRNVAATYLALGLDAKKAVFFRQSDIPEVCELAWLLSTCTNMGLLRRAHSFKDKTDKGFEASVGLFSYPVLMAADILIYDSDVVPVGKDQQQHLEMAQDMARYFNTAYGQGEDLLKYPEWTFSTTPRVPGVDGEKMSKSYNNAIDLFVEGKALKKQVNRIVTDSRPPEEPKDPTALAVMDILDLFLTAEEKEDWHERVRKGGEGAPGYGHLKKEIMAQMDALFGEAREKYAYLIGDAKGQQEVEDILADGAARARPVAQGVLGRCLEAVGMRNAKGRAPPSAPLPRPKSA